LGEINESDERTPGAGIALAAGSACAHRAPDLVQARTPREVLALTENAAVEMAERVDQLFPNGYARP